MDSPGWLIVCHKCGSDYEDDKFQLVPEPITPYSGTAPSAVRASHSRWVVQMSPDNEDVDWMPVEECPTASQRSGSEAHPKGERE